MSFAEGGEHYRDRQQGNRPRNPEVVHGNASYPSYQAGFQQSNQQNSYGSSGWSQQQQQQQGHR